MTKLKDKVEIWEIRIVGRDKDNAPVVLTMGHFSKEALETALHPLPQKQFETLWGEIQEKAKEDLK